MSHHYSVTHVRKYSIQLYLYGYIVIIFTEFLSNVVTLIKLTSNICPPRVVVCLVVIAKSINVDRGNRSVYTSMR